MRLLYNTPPLPRQGKQYQLAWYRFLTLLIWQYVWALVESFDEKSTRIQVSNFENLFLGFITVFESWWTLYLYSFIAKFLGEGLKTFKLKSLIMAQIERWRQA